MILAEITGILCFSQTLLSHSNLYCSLLLALMLKWDHVVTGFVHAYPNPNIVFLVIAKGRAPSALSVPLHTRTLSYPCIHWWTCGLSPWHSSARTTMGVEIQLLYPLLEGISSNGVTGVYDNSTATVSYSSCANVTNSTQDSFSRAWFLKYNSDHHIS